MNTNPLINTLRKILIAGLCVIIPVVAVRFIAIPGLEAITALSDYAISIIRKLALVLTMVLGYHYYVKRFESRKVEELSFSLVKILTAGFLGAVSLGLPVMLLFIKGDYTLIGTQSWSNVADVAFIIFSVAFLEEVIFRGIIFGIIVRNVGLLSALIFPSLIFSLAHFFNENWSSWVGVVSVVLLGVMWSLVYFLTNNLWAATLNHACWNFVIYISGLPLTGEPEWQKIAPFQTEITGSLAWTGGEAGPENSILVILVISIIVFYLFVLARTKEVESSQVIK